MPLAPHESGLDIDEDIRQQQKVWFIERISRGVMALVLLAALAGLLGRGPLSSRTFTDPDSGLFVEYQRFERAHAQTLLRITLHPQQSSAILSLGQDFLDRVKLTRIEPEPVQVRVSADRIIYEFAIAEPGAPTEIAVHYEPLSFGSVKVEMGLEGYPPRAFSQFVYP